ncbi:hypothetical protein Moror_15383 [Moniliophthora roreri MCA 2997]|uniref:Uncharacterized protein n=2 Tax=Moniliophthora roreri TaxID=221103 RepID=V2WN37_MONRO|nr:hypothetical protein Moror_15383 [Moniliophthora roreri MCA 2997]KAI3616487.1 hypothetical protein WG66_011607 [Moniliophthora roreri]KAI3616599.1 hypothetical protein WG66_011608 [Moniliophthora roreri]
MLRLLATHAGAASRTRACLASTRARGIHVSSVVMKKKPKAVTHDPLQEDLFSDEGDLFSTPKPAGAESTLTSTKPTIELAPSKKLSPSDRRARFTALLNTLLPHITPLPRAPTNPTPAETAEYEERRKAKKHLKPIKHSTWKHLVGLAQTKEELEKVVELMPKWKESGHERGFDDEFGGLFVARCEQLSASTLALQVFGNHAKYGVPLTLPAARHLLHSLHATRPLEDVLVAAKLYEVYELGSVEKDVTSNALLLSAAVRSIWGMSPPTPKSQADAEAEAVPEVEVEAEQTEPTTTTTTTTNTRGPTLTLINTLLPSLRQLLTQSKPGTWKTPRTAQQKSKIITIIRRNKEGKKTGEYKGFNREKVWVRWSLSKVQALLDRNEKKGVEWLREWRVREGHVKAVGA